MVLFMHNLTGCLLIEKWQVPYLLRKIFFINLDVDYALCWSRATCNQSQQTQSRRGLWSLQNYSIFNLVCTTSRSSSWPLHYHCLVFRLAKESHCLFSKESHVLNTVHILKNRKMCIHIQLFEHNYIYR